MAQTSRGIKYPYGDDYDEAADVPEAMKEMAESVDDALDDLENDVSDMLDSYVEKEAGKGLSTNDYDDTEKEKVSTAVQPTDYATTSKGGVIKTGSDYCVSVDNNGKLKASQLIYSSYEQAGNNIFIAKGTLENVLTERIGSIETILETLDVGSGV